MLGMKPYWVLVWIQSLIYSYLPWSKCNKMDVYFLQHRYHNDMCAPVQQLKFVTLLIWSLSTRCRPSLPKIWYRYLDINCYFVTRWVCISSTQRQVWLLCGRKGRWCWSWCVTSRPGLWRKPGVRLKNSRTMFSRSRPSWKRCSCGSRGNTHAFWKKTENLFTMSAGRSPVVQSAPCGLTQFPSKIVPQILSGAQCWPISGTSPNEFIKIKFPKFCFYLSIIFSYFIDKTTRSICFCPNFHFFQFLSVVHSLNKLWADSK